MSKYCPDWVFDCIVAQCSIDVIKLGHGLDLICKKYTSGLNNIYPDLSSNEIKSSANIFLKLLVDYNINQNSIKFLENFIYYRFCFVNRYIKRNFKSIFSNPLFTKTKRSYDDTENLSHLQTFLFEWRSKANIKPPKGWNLKTQNNFKELALLAKKPLSEQETKMLLRETKKNEFIDTWTKK